MIYYIDNIPVFKMLITKFRNKQISGEELKKVYIQLATFFVEELSKYFYFVQEMIATPLGEYSGLICQANHALIVSTFEDNLLFSKVIGDMFDVTKYAQLDVKKKGEGGAAEIVQVELPEHIQETRILIFCKSVLATGCTAISIIKRVCEEVKPEKVIILAIIGSNEALSEIRKELPYLNIVFILGEVDQLNDDGMLVPGVGHIENRLNI